MNEGHYTMTDRKKPELRFHQES